MTPFLDALKTQRWDDHRYYHHNRSNQTLHFISAVSFVVAYGWLFIDPVVSALIGWLFSMTTRQSGHFFFEPLGYDHVNQVTNDYKEAVKVGYNLRRKVVLIAIWAAVGGRATLIGPIVGAFFVNGAKSVLTLQIPEFWLYFLGALFILVTLFLPQGIVGLVDRLKGGKKEERA